MSIEQQWYERTAEMMEWLSADPSRLRDVYGRTQNEDETVREAITHLMENDV